jgi:hypothetical protein
VNKALRLLTTPVDFEPESFVNVIKHEVYEVGDQRQGGSKLPASGHYITHYEGHGNGNKAPGDGFCEGAPLAYRRGFLTRTLWQLALQSRRCSKRHLF